MAERFIVGIKGKVIADGGCDEAELVQKIEWNIRPRGRVRKEFTKGPLIGSICL